MIEWVEPSVKLLTGFDPVAGMEYACRNCYQSFDKLGRTNLLAHAVNRGHDSVLEFSEILVEVQGALYKTFWELLKVTCQYPYILEFRSNDNYLFTGNLRAWLNVIDYLLQDFSPLIYREICRVIWDEIVTYYPFLKAIGYGDILPKKVRKRVNCCIHPKVRNVFFVDDCVFLRDEFPSYWYNGRRVVVHLICSRSCQNQIVRHRRFSFLIESQRYVRYDKGLKCIDISGRDDLLGDYPEVGFILDCIYNSVEKSCDVYNSLLAHVPPQVARMVLPNIVASSVMMCGTINEYRQFFFLRDSSVADREIAYLAREMKKIFKESCLI